MLSEGRRTIWHVIVAAAGVIIFAYLITLFIPDRATSIAESSYQFDLPEIPETLPPYPAVAADADQPPIQTLAAVLIDSESGQIVFEKNADTVVPIASTTKLMSAIVAREKLSLDQVVEITREHTSVIGSDMGLRPGEKLTVRDLLTGLLVASGNDAAWALAETASGSREAFVAAMNAKAQQIGLVATSFADPAGLETTSQSTAFELAVIARAALADEFIAEVVRLPEVRLVSTNGLVAHDLKNSNRLVNEFNYLGAIGLKTGYTPEAGHCLVAGAERDGHQLIAVILHTTEDTITASAVEARKLLDWGWAQIDWQ